MGVADLVHELKQPAEKWPRFPLVAEKLGQLSSQDDQGHPIEVADEDGVGKEIGQKTKAQDAQEDMQDPGEQGQADHQFHIPLGIPAGQGADCGSDHQAGGGIGSGDELA